MRRIASWASPRSKRPVSGPTCGSSNGSDPARDAFDTLYADARSEAVIQFLARLALPTDVGAVIRAQVFWLERRPFGYPRSVDTLRSIFATGARWETSSADEIAAVRRALLRMSDSTFVDTMKLVATRDYCAPAILQALARAPSMRARTKKVGFFPSPPDDPRSSSQVRPTPSRTVLAKFGIEVLTAKPRRRTSVRIGAWRSGGREIRLDRAALFERVRSEPVEKLAHGWGLSGRGLSKACQRPQIPVPPRGYWARVQHGQKLRRPRLPELQPGEAGEIVICVPE